MVHCHWEYDLRTSIQIAEAVEPIKPLWLEDPLPVDYSEVLEAAGARASHVPICTGENLARRQGFKDFIINQAATFCIPTCGTRGGFLETKRIADMADVFGLPMAITIPAASCIPGRPASGPASIRDYMTCETVTGQGGWMDQLLVLDGPYIQDGFVQVTDKPGLGVDLNPDVVKAHLASGETWWG